MHSIFGVSGFRGFGVSVDSIRNHDIFLSEKRHAFSWKVVRRGGIF